MEPRQRQQSGAFPRAEALHRSPIHKAIGDSINDQDLSEIRLLLRGESVVDWHRLDLQTHEQVERILALNSLDINVPQDRERIDDLRNRAVDYITKTLKLKLDDAIAFELPFMDIPVAASTGKGRQQRQACVLLKVMHIIYHLDARELRTKLPIADTDLFAHVEKSIVRLFDEIRDADIPVSEFSWSRKAQSSLVTKLMVKHQTRAARVFDRLRFRLVVERADDLAKALHVMLHRCIPFNYVVPGQTVNSLVTFNEGAGNNCRDLLSMTASLSKNWEKEGSTSKNEFSGEEFRVLNFIADLPVRLPEEGEHGGGVVFVMAEFQILDKQTADNNETGDTAHSAYKARQHSRVRERLLRAPSDDESES